MIKVLFAEEKKDNQPHFILATEVVDLDTLAYNTLEIIDDGVETTMDPYFWIYKSEAENVYKCIKKILKQCGDFSSFNIDELQHLESYLGIINNKPGAKSKSNGIDGKTLYNELISHNVSISDIEKLAEIVSSHKQLFDWDVADSGEITDICIKYIDENGTEHECEID